MLHSFFIFLCIQVAVHGQSINLTAIDIFQPEHVSVYKLADAYLFSSVIPDDRLMVVSQTGQKKFIYDKEGRGPQELKHHSVMAISEDKVYVYSQGAGLLIFDHQLKLLADLKNTKLLTSDFASTMPIGIFGEDGRIMIVGHPFLDHHLFYFDLADAFKEPEKRWFPSQRSLAKVNPNHSIKDREACMFHNGYLFTFMTNLTRDRDTYHILVYQAFGDTWKTVMALSREVSDFQPYLPPLIAVVNDVFKTPAGFLVQVAGAHPDPKSLYDNTMYYDYYDHNGTFLKRTSKINHNLIAVQGSDQIFEVVQQDENDLLVPFATE